MIGPAALPSRGDRYRPRRPGEGMTAADHPTPERSVAVTARLVVALLALVCQACSTPIVKRAVDSTPTWLVRLDSYRDPALAARAQYDHPAEWTDANLTEVLEHVRVVGAEEGTPPQPALSYGELSQIAPGIREALHRASATEWVAFAVIQSKATYRTFTSGGLFIKGGKLHVTIANHRVRLPPGKTDVVDPIKATPLRPVGGAPKPLTFVPPEYVVDAEGAWVQEEGEKPVSLVAFDHAAYLAAHASVRTLPTVPAQPREATPRAETLPVPPQAAGSAPTPKGGAVSAGDGAGDAAAKPKSSPDKADLKANLQKLQEERDRLKKLMEGQGRPVPTPPPASEAPELKGGEAGVGQ